MLLVVWSVAVMVVLSVDVMVDVMVGRKGVASVDWKVALKVES